jgi:hypothetical protein
MKKTYRFRNLSGYGENKKFCRMYPAEIELIKFLRDKESILNPDYPYVEIILDLIYKVGE